jgi:hypothetical protein
MLDLKKVTGAILKYLIKPGFFLPCYIENHALVMESAKWPLFKSHGQLSQS